jgi:hypothetical protein
LCDPSGLKLFSLDNRSLVYMSLKSWNLICALSQKIAGNTGEKSYQMH